MYRRESNGLIKHMDFILLNFLCLQLSFVGAFWIREGRINPYADERYRHIIIVITLVDIVVGVLFDTFKNVIKRGYYIEFCKTAKHVFVVEMLAVFYVFLTRTGTEYSRTILCLMGIFQMILSYVVRCAWKYCCRKRKEKNTARRMLIVTEEALLEQTIESLEKHNYEGFCYAGLILMDKDLAGEEIAGLPVVCNGADLTKYARLEWIDEVFFNLENIEKYGEDLLETFLGMGVTVHVKLFENNIQGPKRFTENLLNYTVLTTALSYGTTLQLCFKRFLDICGGMAGCIITGFLFIVLAPLIKLESPGPVLFSQIRIGKNGRKFKIYKFRSMYPDAEERKKELMDQNQVKDGYMFKLSYDPRIIGCKKREDGSIKKGIGNYIREWSLDEFPQFFNVLKGDMSLVGTRPPTEDEWEKYDLHHRARMAIKPGLTGLWQVSGRSEVKNFEDVVKMDTKYICEWSMGLDFRILLKTVKVVFQKNGAM